MGYTIRDSTINLTIDEKAFEAFNEMMRNEISKETKQNELIISLLRDIRQILKDKK